MYSGVKKLNVLKVPCVETRNSFSVLEGVSEEEVDVANFANFFELESYVHDSLPPYLQTHIHPSFIIPLVITLILMIPLYRLLRRIS